MPRFSTTPDTKVKLARAWIKENKPGYDVTYHLLKAAMLADGIQVHGELPADQLRELSAEQQAALATAKSAVGV